MTTPRTLPLTKSQPSQGLKSTMFSIALAVSGALTYLIIYKFILYPIFYSPLSKVPNAHWSAPISPLWILWTRYSCQENRVVHAAHQKHGPIVRLAPNELSVNDTAGLKTVYAGGFEKGEWYSIFDNYGCVALPSLYDISHSDISQSTMHVFIVAFSTTFSPEANDLQRVLQVQHPQLFCSSSTKPSHPL